LSNGSWPDINLVVFSNHPKLHLPVVHKYSSALRNFHILSVSGSGDREPNMADRFPSLDEFDAGQQTVPCWRKSIADAKLLTFNI
jgi:hypothetical protein